MSATDERGPGLNKEPTRTSSSATPIIQKADAEHRVDVAFDFRSDTPNYPRADPDVASPTLRRYHRLLWSKPLPTGTPFDLADTSPGVYLHHRSHLGDFRLASDSVVPTFRKEAKLAAVFDQIPEDLNAFLRLSYTIGGMMLFPGNRIGTAMTINGARGFHPRIKDRFDLTIECIRRHYVGEESPIGPTLARYGDFFRLFGDFSGYIAFFLLQDIVSADCKSVQFFIQFEDFVSSPVPDDMVSYVSYRDRATAFLEARNERISAWWSAHRNRV